MLNSASDSSFGKVSGSLPDPVILGHFTGHGQPAQGQVGSGLRRFTMSSSLLYSGDYGLWISLWSKGEIETRISCICRFSICQLSEKSLNYQICLYNQWNTDYLE